MFLESFLPKWFTPHPTPLILFHIIMFQPFHPMCAFIMDHIYHSENIMNEPINVQVHIHSSTNVPPLWAYFIHLVIEIKHGTIFHLKSKKNLLKAHHEQYELLKNNPFLVPIQLAHHFNITSRNILIPKNHRCNISTCLMWINNVYVFRFTSYYVDAYYRLLFVWEQYPSSKNLH